MSNGCGYILSDSVSTLLTHMPGSLSSDESRRFTSELPASMCDTEADETDHNLLYSDRDGGPFIHTGGIELALQPRDNMSAGFSIPVMWHR